MCGKAKGPMDESWEGSSADLWILWAGGVVLYCFSKKKKIVQYCMYKIKYVKLWGIHRETKWFVCIISHVCLPETETTLDTAGHKLMVSLAPRTQKFECGMKKPLWSSQCKPTTAYEQYSTYSLARWSSRTLSHPSSPGPVTALCGPVACL